MSRKALVPIADGTEEIEAVCIIDVLRRAGISVTVASVDRLQITASRGVKLVADRLLGECVGETYDLIALPGGMPGAEHLRDSEELVEMLKRQRQEGRLYGAICASPVVVLKHHGLLVHHTRSDDAIPMAHRRATCHPDFAAQLEDPQAVDMRVVVDGTCITSRGPGTAVEFALKLVEVLYGEHKAREIAQRMLVA
jgi:4-methyl-5(b-hydroxyethyl)-thiazole monophosphate biosynthesis